MNNRRAEAKQAAARGTTLPTGLLVARFVERYPGLFWAPWWPTRDRIIPYRLFFVLFNAMASVAAIEQFDAYTAALLAGAMLNADESGKASLQRRIDDLLATAYPEVSS